MTQELDDLMKKKYENQPMLVRIWRWRYLVAAPLLALYFWDRGYKRYLYYYWRELGIAYLKMNHYSEERMDRIGHNMRNYR